MSILLVEDDLSLSDVIAFALRRAGFEVLSAYDGLAAVEIWARDKPDLIVLDLNLPLLDGLNVCRRIREESDIPIIILSVRNSDPEIIQGLEMGADDYIVKPFSPGQLIARIRALLRRAGKTPTPSRIAVGEHIFDRSRNLVIRGESSTVTLTRLEAALLEVLMVNAGHVLPYDSIIAAVWGPQGGDRVMLKQLIHRLRGKIEPQVAQPQYIQTIPGVGYTFESTHLQ